MPRTSKLDNQHTTTCEALWMGVPILTLAANRHAARMSASVLHAVGLDDFIARTPEDFIQIARHWSTHLDDLATLRDRMSRSPLCNAPRFTRELEQTYRTLWQSHLHNFPDT